MDIFLKNCCFSGQIWPDLGNATWADMAGLGSIGLKPVASVSFHNVILQMAQSRHIVDKMVCVAR